ncbi:MAG: DUF2723 domain-containing protein [Chloroflexota bacterium]|nr:DUF2723 domain-containing protein [Chloroflexota bacterium]
MPFVTLQSIATARASRPTLAAAHSPYMSYSARLKWGRADWLVAVLVTLSSLCLYTGTLAPTISSTSFDSPELVTKSGLLEMAHIPGSPVYVWLGHVFNWLPFGETATRVNWMSALLASLAVGMLYAVISRHLTGDRLAAVGGSVLFALSLTFWSQAVIAELYAPNMCFLAFVVLAVLEWGAARNDSSRAARWWLVSGAAVFGLSLGVHLSNVLYLPALAVFMLLGWPRSHRSRAGDQDRTSNKGFGLLRRFDVRGGLLALGVGLVAAILPYVWVYFALPHVPYGDFFPRVEQGWPMFKAVTLDAFKEARFGYTLQEVPDRIALFLHLLNRNMGPIGVALLLFGAWRLLFTRLRPFFLLVTFMLANLVFYINYDVPDSDVYYIPTYWVVACFAGMGLEAIAVTLRVLLRVRLRQPRRAPVSLATETRLNFQAGMLRATEFKAILPALVVATLAFGGAGWEWQNNLAPNNMSKDRSLRDFYGNALSMLPQGANLYHRGASLGYDLLYYTRLCGVRQDLHVQAGQAANDPPPGQVPWPQGPVYSSIKSDDAWLPNFIANPDDNNLKWYEPVLTGMFHSDVGMQYGWLNLYRVHPAADPPMDWMVSIEDPASHPSQKLNIDYTSLLTLVGVDAEPQATPGKPWRLVRYWYARGTWIPPMVTVLGNDLAMEGHVPLFDQFEDYVAARNIEDLGNYVVKDETYLVIPSNIAPGRYPVSNAMAKPRLLSLMLDPAKPDELMSNRQVITTVEIVPATEPPPDPLSQATNGRCRR